MNKFIFVFGFCLLLPFIFLGQTQNFDTLPLPLEPVLNNAKAAPTQNISLYNQLSHEAESQFLYDSAFYYLNCSVEIATVHKLIPDLGNAYSLKAHLYRDLNLYSLSIEMLEQAIEAYKTVEDTLSIAQSYNELAINYKNLHLFSNAIQSVNQAYGYYFALKDSTGIAKTETNKGNIFKLMNRPELAFESYFTAISLFHPEKDIGSIANCYNNLGNLHKNIGNYDSAFYYMFKTLEIRKQTQSKRGLSYVYHNLSNLYILQQEYSKALAYVDSSFLIKTELRDTFEIGLDMEVYGDIYFHLEEWSLAAKYYQLAEEYMKHSEYPELFRVHKMLGYSFYHIGNYKKASEKFMAYFDMRDSIFQSPNSQEIEIQLIQFELFKDSLKKEQIKVEQELKQQRDENENLSNEVIRRNYYLIIGTLVVALIIFVRLYLNYRYRLRKNKVIQSKLQNQNQVLKKTSVPKEEKEVLLREVHHRVKNNFQIINSLIRIQGDFINANNYKEKLKEIENRIKSMSLIHEKLYKNDKISKLSVNEYIKELSAYIIESYEVDVPIHFDIAIDEKEYGIDTLIPLGLILNETISNAIKHAFYDRSSGELSIHLKNTETNTFLEIKDNGIGADLSFEELKEDSLGMELIESLTDQLDGTFELDTEKGFHYSFTFRCLK